MEKIFAIILLILIFPLLLIISLLVFFFIDKKIIFKQKRVGKDGAIFIIYKFSSMLNNSKKKTNLPSHLEFNRINFIGNLLRINFLDELLQVINVIKGDMSFFGPRPHPVNEHKYFKEKIISWSVREKVKPGLTGYAQSKKFYGPIKNDIDLFKRVSHDRYYLRYNSFTLKLKIIYNTLLILLRL